MAGQLSAHATSRLCWTVSNSHFSMLFAIFAGGLDFHFDVIARARNSYAVRIPCPRR
jgi:hypothetical protein